MRHSRRNNERIGLLLWFASYYLAWATPTAITFSTLLFQIFSISSQTAPIYVINCAGSSISYTQSTAWHHPLFTSSSRISGSTSYFINCLYHDPASMRIVVGMFTRAAGLSITFNLRRGLKSKP